MTKTKNILYISRSVAFFFTALFFVVSQSSLAQSTTDSVQNVPDSTKAIETTWDTNLKRALTSLSVEASENYYNTSFTIWDLTADSLLFAYNPQKVMRPASTEKIMTAVAALSLLGADYEYKTRAYYTGSISPDSILKGDVYVIGAFDPAYSYSDLKELAQSIRSLNIKSIEGNFYADISMKDSLLYGRGWCWDDVPSSNTPYLCPLMLERGQIAPFDGHYSTSPTFHPSLYFMQTLAHELSDLGCDTLNYYLKSFDATIPSELFYTKTRTIADILPHMMKKSDNLYAESMFFQLAHINKDKATWEDGARQVLNVIRQADADASYVEVVDGSGVSLYNYSSTQTEVAVLRYAYKHEDIYNPLLASLPIAGVDGTLKNRMKEAPAYKNVHGKTGTLSGVSSLAGYVMASNGHTLAFSIISNGLMKVATGKAFQDRICQVLSE